MVPTILTVSAEDAAAYFQRVRADSSRDPPGFNAGIPVNHPGGLVLSDIWMFIGILSWRNPMTFEATPIDPAALKANNRSGYPEPFRSQVLPREKRALGDAAGLTKIGINHTTLRPGAVSSMRHWHTQEDELVYVLSGELVLVTDAGEQALKAGQCAGFPAGHQNGHQLVNRGPVPAVYLEISNRDKSDAATYPDVDLRWNAPDAPECYSHKDGRPY